ARPRTKRTTAGPRGWSACGRRSADRAARRRRRRSRSPWRPGRRRSRRARARRGSGAGSAGRSGRPPRARARRAAGRGGGRAGGRRPVRRPGRAAAVAAAPPARRRGPASRRGAGCSQSRAHAHEEVHAFGPAAERHGPVESEAAEAEAEAGVGGEVVLAGAASLAGVGLVPCAARVEEDDPGGRRAEVDARDAAAEVVRQRQADLVLELDERHAVAAVERIELRLDEDVVLDDAEPVAARAAVELERPVARQRALAAERMLALWRERAAVERARDERADRQPRAGPGAGVTA